MKQRFIIHARKKIQDQPSSWHFTPRTARQTKVQGQVTDAHDPPQIGAADDRYPRGGESYVKDFEPLTLGTIHLNAGRGTLTLRALDISNSQVMDVRRVMLIRR